MNSILEYLERSAMLFPDRTACADVNTSVTFSQLLERTRRVGSCLAKLTEERTPIAFLMEKSVDAVVGFLGAVQAGCFYATVNPQHPPARMKQVLDILNPAVLVTTNLSAAKQTDFEGAVLELSETMAHDDIDEVVLRKRRAAATDLDPLYVMFTSGSTGAPKGVVVCHRSVIDFIDNFITLFSVDDSDIIGNQAPFDFDISVKDIYSALAAGARLEIIPRRLFSFPSDLARHLCDRKITTLIWAVSALRVAAAKNAFGLHDGAFSVNKILFSGEPISAKLLRYWQVLLPGAVFVNLYGPTEITCNCAYHVVDRQYTDDEVVPMGGEYPNKRLFLLDEDGCSVSRPGLFGELCVTGSGLALGYYNNQDISAAVFRQNPLRPNWREWMYCTGDLARYGEDGLLYYVGRKDSQVKHHGHRIEMGDIEFAALSVSCVEQCCCVYKRDTIILFYEGDAVPESIISVIRSRLPSFMIPGKVVRMEQLPTTPNGKVNRVALAKKYGEEADGDGR